MLSARVGQYFKWVGQSPEWVGHGLSGLGLEARTATGREGGEKEGGRGGRRGEIGKGKVGEESRNAQIQSWQALYCAFIFKHTCCAWSPTSKSRRTTCSFSTAPDHGEFKLKESDHSQWREIKMPPLN